MAGGRKRYHVPAKGPMEVADRARRGARSLGPIVEIPTIRRFRAVVRVALPRWLAPRISLFASALAFRALLALAPVLLIVLSLAGHLLGEEEARSTVAESLVRFAGRGSEDMVAALLAMVTPTERLTTGTFLGVALLLFFASSFFAQLHAALDAVWEIRLKTFRRALLDRLISLGETVLALAAALVVLALAVLRSVVWPILQRSGAAGEAAWMLWTRLATFLMIAGVLGMAFRYVPSIRPRPSWAAVLAGVLPTTILLNLASEVIGVIITRSALASLYGAAGSVIIFLLWVYYSSWIFLFGAEVCRAWDEAPPSAGWTS